MQLRDVKMVGVKLKHVLLPRDTVKELRNCEDCSCRSYLMSPCLMPSFFASRGLVGTARAVPAAGHVSFMCAAVNHALTTLCCSTLSLKTEADQTALTFATVFVIVWCAPRASQLISSLLICYVFAGLVLVSSRSMQRCSAGKCDQAVLILSMPRLTPSIVCVVPSDPFCKASACWATAYSR